MDPIHGTIVMAQQRWNRAFSFLGSLVPGRGTNASSPIRRISRCTRLRLTAWPAALNASVIRRPPPARDRRPSAKAPAARTGPTSSPSESRSPTGSTCAAERRLSAPGTEAHQALTRGKSRNQVVDGFGHRHRRAEVELIDRNKSADPPSRREGDICEDTLKSTSLLEKQWTVALRIHNDPAENSLRPCAPIRPSRTPC